MKATLLTPEAFMRLTTPATMSSNGWDVETIQSFSLPGKVRGVGEISGVFSSLATAATAMAPGTPEVPISTSTFSSFTSLRALRPATDGSEASSSTMSLT